MKMTSQYKTTRKQYDNTDEHETDMIYNNHDSRNKKTTWKLHENETKTIPEDDNHES